MDTVKTNRAVLFFDLKGWYAGQKDKSAAQIAEDLNAFYSETIDLVTAHNGRVVKFMGDAGLVVFEKTRDAADFAGILVSRHEANVGMESGEIVEGSFGKDSFTWFDVFGPAVNEAGKNMGKARKSSKGIVAGPAAWTELTDEERKNIELSTEIN
jgi:class 3 adenylate cyclase